MNEDYTECCGYMWSREKAPIYWNPDNKVVQCNNCGVTYIPEPGHYLEGK